MEKQSGTRIKWSAAAAVAGKQARGPAAPQTTVATTKVADRERGLFFRIGDFESRRPTEEPIAEWRKIDAGRAILDRADRLRDQIEGSELWWLIQKAVAATKEIDTGFATMDWQATCKIGASKFKPAARCAFEAAFVPALRTADALQNLHEALQEALGLDGVLIISHRLGLELFDLLPPEGTANEAARRMADAHRRYPGDSLQLEPDGGIARFTYDSESESPPVADAPKWKPIEMARALNTFRPPATWSSDVAAFLKLAENLQRVANEFAACASLTNAELANPHRPAGRTGIPERRALIVWARKNGLPATDAAGARRKRSIQHQLSELLAALAIAADGNRVPSPMDRNGDDSFRYPTERQYRAAIAAWPKEQGRRHYDLLHHVMRQKEPRGEKRRIRRS